MGLILLEVLSLNLYPVASDRMGFHKIVTANRPTIGLLYPSANLSILDPCDVCLPVALVILVNCHPTTFTTSIGMKFAVSTRQLPQVPYSWASF